MMLLICACLANEPEKVLVAGVCAKPRLFFYKISVSSKLNLIEKVKQFYLLTRNLSPSILSFPLFVHYRART